VAWVRRTLGCLFVVPLICWAGSVLVGNLINSVGTYGGGGIGHLYPMTWQRDFARTPKGLKWVPSEGRKKGKGYLISVWEGKGREVYDSNVWGEAVFSVMAAGWIWKVEDVKPVLLKNNPGF
jgi:hypothetical protein